MKRLGRYDREDVTKCKLGADPPHEIRRLVNNRDIVPFGGQLSRNMIADLTRAADDDFHRQIFPVVAVLPDSVFLGLFTRDPKQLKLPMQGGTLHTDESRGARNVSTKSRNLRL